MAIVRIVFRADTGVSVIRLIESARMPGESDAQFLARCMAKIPDFNGLESADMDESQLPTRGDDRNRWKHRLVNGRREIFVDLVGEPVFNGKRPR